MEIQYKIQILALTITFYISQQIKFLPDFIQK